MNRFALRTALVLLLASPAALAGDTEPALAVSADDAGLAWGPCPDFMPEGCGIAVLHGDPAGPSSDVFFKVPGGSVIPHHWHTSPERMVLVSGELEVRYDGQESRTLRAGMYAYGPARLGHSAVCAAGEPCILFISFTAPVDAVPTD
ncbi:cupin domain-containing protein [Arenimonas aestuarii]